MAICWTMLRDCYVKVFVALHVASVGLMMTNSETQAYGGLERWRAGGGRGKVVKGAAVIIKLRTN